MYKLASYTTKKVGPKEAKSYLVFNTFEGQRDHNTKKSDNFADLIREGKMRPVEMAFADLPDGTRFMMNGQHGANGIIKSEIPHLASITYFDCETNEDLWTLFATFDVHAPRTERQIIKAARGLYTCDGLHSIQLRTLANCGSALHVLGEGNNPIFGAKAPTDKTIKAHLVDEHADEVMWVNEILDFMPSIAERRMMEKVGVVAAMISTFRVCPDKSTAADFWMSVGTGEMLSVSSPEYKLRSALALGAPGVNGHRQLRSLYILCITWWNSWITKDRRRTVNLALINETPRPLTPRK